MPSFPELSEPLSDGVVELRPASDWDIPDILIAHQDDRELYRRLGMERPPSGAELGRRSEREAVEWTAGAGVRLTIVESGSRTCSGQLDACHVDWADRSAVLGIWLAPAVRGQGWGRRALGLGADWLFDAAGLERLTLTADSQNPALIRAAQAAGFTETSRVREAVSLTLVRPLPAPPKA